MKAARKELARLQATVAMLPAPAVVTDPKKAEALRFELLALAAEWYEDGRVNMPPELVRQLEALDLEDTLAAWDLSALSAVQLAHIEHLYVCRNLTKPWAELVGTLREAHREAFGAYPAHFPADCNARRLRWAAERGKGKTGVEVTARMVELATAG